MQVSGVNFYANMQNSIQTNFQSRSKKSNSAIIGNVKKELKNVKATLESEQKEVTKESRRPHMRPAPDFSISDKESLEIYLKQCKICRKLGLGLPHPIN